MSARISPARRRREAGFTLVELMYATGYFAIGLAGLVTFQVVAAQSSSRTADLASAINLTVGAMEVLRTKPPGYFTSVLNTPQIVNSRRDSAAAVASQYFTTTTTITRPATPNYPGGANYYEIIVKTSWSQPGSTFVHNVVMQTRRLKED
jgi:Tfp pilus assembly protein PilV